MVQLVRTDAFILFFLGAVEWGARDVDQAYAGTLQEDPLSPYLFIIAINTLQYIFHKATQEGLLSPLRDRVDVCLSTQTTQFYSLIQVRLIWI
jgi:hypothetical protein